MVHGGGPEDPEGQNYYYDTYKPWCYNYTITMKNGTQYQTGLSQAPEDLNIPELAGFSDLQTNVSSADNQTSSPWVVGNEYQLTATFAGVSDDFLWKIEETPVESITVSDVTILEHTNGEWNSDPSGANRFFYYWNWIYAPSDYSLTMKNGNTYSNYDYVPELDGFLDLYWETLKDDQSFENPWVAGGIYPVQSSYAGVSTEYNIRIVSSPIKQVIVEDVVLLENYNGYYVNPGTAKEYYYYYINPSTYTVEFNDGSIFDVTPYNYFPELENYHFDFTNIQDENNHFEVGEQYSIVGNYGGVETSVNVTVEESPIADFIMEDITLRQGKDDLQYKLHEDTNFTVTMKNGKEYNISVGDNPQIDELSKYEPYPYARDFLNIDYSFVGDSYNWQVGTTHEVKVNFAGKEALVNVHVIANPTYTDRIFAGDRYGTAKKVGDKYKDITGKQFQNVVVACGDNYPDALAGGYLAKEKNAPILLVTSSNENEIATYIKTNMNPNGTVYLLGGTGVVSSAFENKIKNNKLKVKRLGGADRFATNLEILKEAGAYGLPLLVCTGYGYADSLSASAVGMPILLVGDTINAQQKAFLQSQDDYHYRRWFFLIGGPGAVKESVRTSLKSINSNYQIERIYGQSRYETSTAVADYFFWRSDNVVLAYAQNFPDGLSGGPLAMQIEAPIILVDSNNTTAAAAYVKRAGVKGSITLGGPALISDAAINRILGR